MLSEIFLNRTSVEIRVADKCICNENSHTPISLGNLCRDELATQVQVNVFFYFQGQWFSTGFPESTWFTDTIYGFFSYSLL